MKVVTSVTHAADPLDPLEQRMFNTTTRSKLTTLFLDFFESEQASGVILIICTLVSMAVANSAFGTRYLDFWHYKIGIDASGFILKYSIQHWINDALMAVFFLLIGLEIERELYIGELSDLKSAALPIIAAIGGMLLPALCHFLFNHGTVAQRGIGIPMATDIAFALGVLALVGSSIPASLKVFLTALAIVDDLGAIFIIALFYVQDFSPVDLFIAAGIFAALLVLNRLGVSRLRYYLVPGLFMWYFMLQSGVHATLAGVLLAFAVPFGSGDEQSPSYRLQHFLHRPVAFMVMPLFALANTGIALTGNLAGGLATPNSIGIMTGLFIGKPLGIVLFSVLAVKMGLAALPAEISWRKIIGAGFLGGIGFTMSFFIALLAFQDPALIEVSKTAVLIGSVVAGATGFLILKLERPAPQTAGR